jgi:hypothetical protein
MACSTTISGSRLRALTCLLRELRRRHPLPRRGDGGDPGAVQPAKSRARRTEAGGRPAALRVRTLRSSTRRRWVASCDAVVALAAGRPIALGVDLVDDLDPGRAGVIPAISSSPTTPRRARARRPVSATAVPIAIVGNRVGPSRGRESSRRPRTCPSGPEEVGFRPGPTAPGETARRRWLRNRGWATLYGRPGSIPSSARPPAIRRTPWRGAGQDEHQ